MAERLNNNNNSLLEDGIFGTYSDHEGGALIVGLVLFFTFKFHWDVIDIYHCISLRGMTQIWLLYIMNDYYTNLGNTYHLI